MLPRRATPVTRSGLAETYRIAYICGMNAQLPTTSPTNAQTVALTEARDNIKAIVDEVVETGTEYTITRHGKPVAVILAYDEYEALLETLNILGDDETMDAIAEAQDEMSG
jgi:antitoxin YefM